MNCLKVQYTVVHIVDKSPKPIRNSGDRKFMKLMIVERKTRYQDRRLVIMAR